jgi:hypothetical protein
MVLGPIIGVIACFQGMRSQGGTEGVGRSATSAVVPSSFFVMLADVILVKLILVFFPRCLQPQPSHRRIASAAKTKIARRQKA